MCAFFFPPASHRRDTAPPALVALLHRRFESQADWLRGREHLAGEFSAADILVTAVLRMVEHTQLLADWPGLVACRARCQGRPAFQRALDDQMAAFAQQSRGA